ncbi:MAG: protein-disulfide reductase DsbD domain-containing protein, partial [Gammaproteobacteria bacterium]
MTLLRRFATLCAFMLLPLSALAFSEKDLLPVDQAFELSARATAPGRVELHWKIAPGYYLYRHRMGVGEIPGFKQNPLQLPDGHKKHDDFFGEVETYRDEVTAVLTGAAADGVDALQLEVRYQGCADAGVCYPPQKRRLEVRLPGPGTAAALPSGTLPSAGNTAPSPLASRLPGAGVANLAGVEALPLPAEQAFEFEAIAGDGNTLLLRFTPAPGYYLYRDRTS